MTPGLRRRGRLSIAATGAIAAAIVGSSGGALAGPPPAPYVMVELTDPCLSGYQITPGATVTLTLKRSGTVAAKSTFKVNGTQFGRCLSVAPLGGDRLVIKQVKDNVTLSNRTLELPRLTVALAAATKVLSVHGELAGAPMSGQDVLQGPTLTVGGRATIGTFNTITFDSNGDASQDWTSPFDITHGFTGFAM